MTGGWSGRFAFGPDWAAYRGPAADNAPHAHLAGQLALGHERAIAVELDGGARRIAGRIVLVAPGARHRLIAAGPVTLLYADPVSPLDGALRARLDGRPAAALRASVFPGLTPVSPAAEWAARLRPAAAVSAPDPRVAAAMAWLEATAGPASIVAAARAAGLSPSHLRALVRDGLGFPLAGWLLWRKLARATLAMADGAGLAEAAAAAGFADQAHLARAMRRMFGISPGRVRPALATLA